MSAPFWFFHLERLSLDQALPSMLETCLGRGQRAFVRSPAPERIQMLDDHLWTYRDDGFLPHGRSGEPNAARQPVLLSTGAENENAAQVVFLLDDADPIPLAGVERSVILFDGGDGGAVAAARARWKSLKAEGRELSYRRQDAQGRWEIKG